MDKITISKEEFFQIFEKAHTVLNELSWDLDCLAKCSGLCELDAVVLLPYENEFLKETLKLESLLFSQRSLSKDLKVGYIGKHQPHCPALEQDGKTCKIYPLCPIDCLSFPLIPEFGLHSDEKIEFHISSYCRLRNNLRKYHIEKVKEVWYSLSPYLPLGWKRYYNEKIKPSLYPLLITQR